MDIHATDFIFCVIAEITGIDSIPPARSEDEDITVRTWHRPIEPVASIPLIFGIGFEVFLQQVAEQVVIGVDALFFALPLCPILLEYLLGLDVCDTAHASVHEKSEKFVFFNFLVQVLVSDHSYLIPNRLLVADGHLHAGVAISVVLVGHHADSHWVSSAGTV